MRVRHRVALASLLAACLAACGCFNQALEMRPRDLVRIGPMPPSPRGASAPLLSLTAAGDHPPLTASTSTPDSPTVRDWLRHAHARLKPLLPFSPFAAMLTDDLSRPDGSPADVFGHFWINPRTLRMLLPNLCGFIRTVQGTASSFAIEEEAPPWPGFKTVWIPVQDDVKLCCRLGLAYENGKVKNSNCVIILPGFFGDHSVVRSRDMADAFVSAGIHALSLEMRGHGQVERRYPDKGYTFGVIESGDLLFVDEWLRKQSGIERTGVVGFCWGANTGILAAWLDGRPADDPNIGDSIRALVPPPSTERHFEAGVFCFSPAVQFEEAIEACDAWTSPGVDPTTYALQQVVRWRIKFKNWGRPHYSLRRLIDREFTNSVIGMDKVRWRESLRFLRLLPFRDRPAGEKLQHARVPLLIMHAADDPFIPAQRIAELVAGVANPNVAAIILPGSGHIGFAPYSRGYYYSMMVNFFDPVDGAAARTAPRGVTLVDQADRADTTRMGTSSSAGDSSSARSISTMTGR